MICNAILYLQARHTQSQRRKKRVQQRNNTNKHNVQHQFYSQDEQRQCRRQRVQKHQKTCKTQDRNGSSNGGEDLNDDQGKQSTNGNQLALLLGLGLDVLDISVGDDGALLGRGADVRERVDLVGRGCDGGGDEGDLGADLGGGSGLLEDVGRGGERGESGVCGC
jgi:hypothetical protein